MQVDAPRWLDPLREQLLPQLLAAGLDIDTRSWLNIEAWLDAALQHDLLTDDPRSAQGALRAIVSKSARDQLLFDQVFESWRQRWDHAAELLGKTAGPATTDPAPSPGQGRKPARSSARLAYRVASVAVLVLGVSIAFDYAKRHLAKNYAPPGVELPVQPPKGGTTGGSTPIIREIELAGTVDVGQIEVQAPPWLFGLHPAGYAALVIALGSVGWFARRTRKDQLARIATRENLREQQVFARQLLPVSGERRVALRAAARRLRRPHPTERWVLDIDASARATASRAGAFAPVHRQRMAMPEYLFLVDRAGSGDQQAHWAAEMARDLAVEGVALALYEFDRDLRWVAPLRTQRSTGVGEVQTYVPLSILASRHAGQGLVVLSDGHGFIDPAAGTLCDWLQTAVAPWPRRVLMTPRPPSSWGAAEDILAGEGGPAHAEAFLVLPARIDMLSAAARWFDGGVVPEVGLLPGAPAELPPLLRDDPARWIGRDAPSDIELPTLVSQLRGFLGQSTYAWLAASAAYPHLSADLTAYLARQLGDASPPTARNDGAPPDARLLEARLLAIAQLPWCRAGLMPDWLRRALFLSLAPETREQVRAVLMKLFRAAGQDDTTLGVSLGVVASGDFEPGPRAMLRRLGRRIGLSGVVENEPPDSPLRDVIYLGVLRGGFDPALSLDATAEFARAVRAETGSRLTRNPLRWLAATTVVALYPLLWLQWWARGPLLRPVMGTGRKLLQTWRAAYTDAERFYAAVGHWFVRAGARLFGARPAATPSTPPAARVYLSYSRVEAEAATQALRERLVVRLGLAIVWDGTLDSRADAAEELRGALKRCTLMVAFIDRSAFRDKTWQVEEIAYALDAGKPVIPVLVDGAVMPDAASLPASISALARYHAFTLHADRIDADLDRLADEIVLAAGEGTAAA